MEARSPFSIAPGFGRQFNVWLEVKCLLLWWLQLVVSFLTCLLESKLLLQESILAVCEGLIFSSWRGAVLGHLQLKGRLKAAVPSALAQGKFCCQNPLPSLFM